MEQIEKTDSKPFIYKALACSMQLEQSGTDGTEPICEHLLISLPATSSTSSSLTRTIMKTRANKKPPKGFGYS